MHVRYIWIMRLTMFNKFFGHIVVAWYFVCIMAGNVERMMLPNSTVLQTYIVTAIKTAQIIVWAILVWNPNMPTLLLDIRTLVFWLWGMVWAGCWWVVWLFVIFCWGHHVIHILWHWWW